MTTREPKAATYLAAILAQEHFAAMSLREQEHVPPCKAARDAESLVRLGKRAARLAEQRCNGIPRYDAKARQMLASWTEADDVRAEKTAARILKEASGILARYGVTDIKVDGDPRGFALKFKLASGQTNSFGREIWGV